MNRTIAQTKPRAHAAGRGVAAFLCALAVMIGLAAHAQPAYAAGQAASLALPVEVAIEGAAPDQPESYTVVLKADDAADPLPDGAAGGTYTLAIDGPGTATFPAITYATPGIYTYTVYQQAGANDACTYDDAVYTLAVYATNAEDGSGLEVTAALHPAGDAADKLGTAKFTNVYPTAPEPAEPEVGQPAEQLSKTGDVLSEAGLALLGILALVAVGGLVISRKKIK